MSRPSQPGTGGTTGATGTASRHDADLEQITEAVLTASRGLVAIAARSLAGTEKDVTLAQYRVLVLLASRGPQRLADLAGALSVAPSTATRVCDRLVTKGLIRRHRAQGDRREIRVALSPTGGQLVADVTVRRRQEIRKLVRAVAPAERPAVVAALTALAQAAGEVPERDWALGWA